MNRLLDQLFGCQAGRLHLAWSQLRQLSEARASLLEALDNLRGQKDACVSTTQETIDRLTAEVANLRTEGVNSRQRVDNLEKQAVLLAEPFRTGWRRFLLGLANLLGMERLTVADLRRNHAEFLALQKEAIQQLAELDGQLSRTERQLRGLTRPLDSLCYAIACLEEDLADLLRQETALHAEIDQAIWSAWTVSPLLLVRRCSLLRSLAEGDNLVRDALRLRSLLCQSQALRGCPSISRPEPVANQIGQRLGDAMKAVLSTPRQRLGALINLAGCGKAHKRVRRGKHHRTVEVEVGLQGSVAVEVVLETRNWTPAPLSSAVAQAAWERFEAGRVQGQTQMIGRLQADLQTQIHALTLTLRSAMETAVTTPRPQAG